MGAGHRPFNRLPRGGRPRRPRTGRRDEMPNRPRFSKILLLCGGVLALSLAACSPTLDQRGNLPDPEKLAEIQPGVKTKDEVTKLLGTPSAVGTFDSKTWYY